MGSKKTFLTSCTVLTFLLLGYGLHRYNGFDLASYFELIRQRSQGVATYGERPLSLYPPPGVYLLQALRFLPEKWVHLAWYVLSVVLFLRLTYVTFKILNIPLSPLEKRDRFVLWFSWLAILQGLGAQLEGGNINFALMILIFEGLYLLERKPDSFGLQLWGLFLIWMPVLFKPYLGLISVGLTLLLIKQRSWKFVLAPLVLGFVSNAIPVLLKGTSSVIQDYRNWLSGDVNYIDCAFTLKCNAVNYSLPSFLYQVWNWDLKSIFAFSALIVILALIYSLREKNPIKLVTILSQVTFIISPASFPYTLILLWLSVVVILRALIGMPEKKKDFLALFGGGVFVAALVFLNPTYVGREFFNQVIVPYRITTFFVLLGVGVVFKLDWRRERDSNSR